jgi:hypothetical protein
MIYTCYFVREIRQSFKLYILFFFVVVVVVVEMAIKYFDSWTEIPTMSIIIAPPSL